MKTYIRKQQWLLQPKRRKNKKRRELEDKERLDRLVDTLGLNQSVIDSEPAQPILPTPGIYGNGNPFLLQNDGTIQHGGWDGRIE